MVNSNIAEKTVYYLGYYDPDGYENYYNLAAKNKMNYIIRVLNELGFKVDVLSASHVFVPLKKIIKKEIINSGKNTKVQYFNYFAGNNIFIKIFDTLFINFQIFVFLFLKIKANQTLIVYHNTRYSFLVKLLKRIKKINLVIEVEEIYADVVKSIFSRKSEYNLFNLADKFIFSTELLENQVNHNKKPYAIVYGNYNIEKQLVKNVEINTNKIDIVYAGNLDPRKGVELAINTGVHLSPDYHIHILGGGSEERIKELEDQIMNQKTESSALVTYDGVKTGDDFLRSLQSCKIGLCTQTPVAGFTQTSFPSKVLTYLVNGLRVVSVKIDSLYKSKISNELSFYELNSPIEVAKVIKSIDLNKKYDSRSIIKQLDLNFKKDLERLI